MSRKTNIKMEITNKLNKMTSTRINLTLIRKIYNKNKKITKQLNKKQNKKIKSHKKLSYKSKK